MNQLIKLFDTRAKEANVLDGLYRLNDECMLSGHGDHKFNVFDIHLIPCRGR